MTENALKVPVAPITDQQIHNVEDLLHSLKGKAQAAVAEGDIYMASVYAELVKVTSPIVNRAYARKDREEKANINRGVKDLRKQAQAEAEAEAEKQKAKKTA